MPIPIQGVQATEGGKEADTPIPVKEVQGADTPILVQEVQGADTPSQAQPKGLQLPPAVLSPRPNISISVGHGLGAKQNHK